MKHLPLKDVCKVTTGQSAPQGDENFSDHGLPFIRAGSLEPLLFGQPESSLELIEEKTAKKYKLKLLPKDTILFAKSGMSAKIGRVYRLKSPAYVVSHLAAVVPGESIDPSYLQRWFEYNPPSRLIPNDAYPSIRTSEIEKLQISLPPIKEQRRIAGILDKADSLRRKRAETLKLLDQFLRSVFLDMFGDPNGARWDYEPLSHFLKNERNAMRTGPFGSQLLHSEFVSHGIAVLGIDNAVQNRFCWAKERFITEEKYEKLTRYTVHPHDVLITIMGTCGRCAIVPQDCGIAINTKHLCCITFDQSKCLPEFFHSYFLLSPIVNNYLSIKTKGAIMDGLNMGIIRDMPLARVPMAQQKAYIIVRKKIDILKQKFDGEQIINDDFFNSLTQRAFRGEL